MRFAHLGDCHLGGWRFQELQELNMQSFSQALDISIKEKLDMVLIAGDLFDSAYPSIEILKQTFAEFKKLKDANIPGFIIAGSHDYSAAGKTFLDVLEHAGFCTNVFKKEEKDDKIILQQTIFKNYAIYGYPGKKTGLEIPELKNVLLQDSPGFFRILMLHTTLKEAIGSLPIESISLSELPELNYGGFYIVEFNQLLKATKIPIRLKEVLSIKLELASSLTSTEKIISELNKHILEDKIVLLKLSGTFPNGKMSDIRFNEVEQFVKNKKAYSFIKNISKLSVEESAIKIEATDMHKVEDDIMETYFASNPTKFSDKVPLF